jgi:hypothetical protein
MDQLHPTIAASIAGFAPRFMQTSCSQCGKSLGPGNAGVSKCAEHRTPTDSHWTKIGEGDASVECRYHFDSDGDLDALMVMLDNTDIAAALTCQQLGELEDKCRAALKADAKDREYDRGQDAYEERMAAA